MASTACLHVYLWSTEPERQNARLTASRVYGCRLCLRDLDIVTSRARSAVRSRRILPLSGEGA